MFYIYIFNTFFNLLYAYMLYIICLYALYYILICFIFEDLEMYLMFYCVTSYKLKDREELQGTRSVLKTVSYYNLLKN